MGYHLTRRDRGFTLHYPGDGDAVLEQDFLQGEGTALFTRAKVTLLKGQVKYLDGVEPDQIQNSDTSTAFADMDELRNFIAGTIFGTRYHSEIVMAEVGTVWTAFEPAPCTELVIQNASSVDIVWNKGDATRYMVIPAGEQKTVSGITNSDQVQLRQRETEGGPGVVDIFAEAIYR